MFETVEQKIARLEAELQRYRYGWSPSPLLTTAPPPTFLEVWQREQQERIELVGAWTTLQNQIRMNEMIKGWSPG